MSNPFLTGDHSEIETAIMLDKAMQCDLSKISESYKNSVAFTDGNKIFINDDDNLARILPAYDHKMLKWLLWHERMHMDLRHHNRYFKYIRELTDKDLEDKFHVTKEEVNIIMDILVHDWESAKFPELVETAQRNLAQFRNRNSLGFTFTTNTLEEMLDEYSKHKHGEDKEKSKDGEPEEDSEDEDGKDTPADDKKDIKDKGDKAKKTHAESGESKDTPDDKTKEKAEDGEPEDKDSGKTPPEVPSEHDKTDWKQLEEIDQTEFIDEYDANRIMHAVAKLRRKKFKLAKLTQTLNGLATTNKTRTYRTSSLIQMGDGCIFKGKMPGKTQLYLVFDASGSMSDELTTFKEIISKTIPQAMDCPCEWFAGFGAKIDRYKNSGYDGYYKGKFKDIMCVHASSGYDDDGDRTIELCYLAEQKGYSPIGVTDGGGQLSWSKDMLKKLKKTVLVGQNARWLEKCKSVNPKIQILDIDAV